MKKNILSAAAVLIACILPVCLSAQQTDWNTVLTPEIISVSAEKDNPKVLQAQIRAVTGPQGASQVFVEMLDENKNIMDSTTLGRSKNEVRSVSFTPSKTGTYGIRASARRSGQNDKVSEITWFKFRYPLETPSVSILNGGQGTFNVSWKPVKEATAYAVYYNDESLHEQKMVMVQETETVISGLASGHKVSVKVTALRGTDSSSSAPVTLTVRQEKDREWKFTWFGQSSNGDRNTMEMIDPDNLTFKLKSCTYDPKTLSIIDKGGKFTTFHDGISFYYTRIDAAKENFDLEATFTVDYINIMPDGQEGFGLIAMDSLGQDGINMTNHYTNSAAVIATKMEEHFGETKKSSKDTMGVRFVTDITPAVLAGGDKAIAEHGTSVQHAFSYDPSDIVKAGDKYRIRLVKDNSGYRAIFDKAVKSEDTVTEYRLWGPEKLLQLDKKYVYVGFAAARGCNVTVSDVSMKITDPAKDAPRKEEPPQMVPLAVKVDSPTTYGESQYPFVFTANADGLISIKDKDENIILPPAAVKAGRDFTMTGTLPAVFNDFVVTFAPDKNFRPQPKAVIAQYNKDLKQWEENYNPVSITCSVIYLTYAGSELYVSPEGSALGKGTREDPLDLATGVNFCRPGQPVYLMEGTYYPAAGLVIQRGNSGKAAKDGRKAVYKELLADPQAKTRPVINFSTAKGGMTVWGDWWHMKGFDVTATPGDIKGIQVGGSHNIMEQINTYENGDTGMQISGNSTEPQEKWPEDDLILNCTSWGNCDPAQNNADGFAAKLTCREGNVFRGCISYSNIDDGWDLFSKIESGPIGSVLIENCVAYKNGHRPDGTGNGDGNGFKLGGDGIAVKHILRNCVSYANGASGITCNSNPAIIVLNDTSYGNGGYNITLYGKGNGERSFKVQGLLSFEGTQGGMYSEPSKGWDGKNL